MKLLVAIPALNEDKSVAKVIANIVESLPSATILVIDDGSTDETVKVALRSGARVASMPFNIGVGGALRVAFKFALENGYTHVIQIDADGQHLPSEAKKLILESDKYSIVIGSRFSGKSNSYKTSAARRFAIASLSLVISKICKVKLTDVTSGFRIASGKAIPLFAESYPREYLGDTVESLLIANRAGLKISEVPVEMNQREFGDPSQNFSKSFWYLVRAMLIILLSLIKRKNY